MLPTPTNRSRLRLFPLCLCFCVVSLAFGTARSLARPPRGPTPEQKAELLAAAARGGDLDEVRRYLGVGFDVNTRLPDGSTVLAWAAFSGDLAVVRFLHEHGAEVNPAPPPPEPPIVSAARGGTLEVVQYLARAGADARSRDEAGQTALMAAAGRRELPELSRYLVVRYLAARGADLAVRDRAGRSALSLAGDGGGTPTVRYLLEQGAKLSKQQGELEGFVDLAGRNDDPLLLNIVMAEAARQLSPAPWVGVFAFAEGPWYAKPEERRSIAPGTFSLDGDGSFEVRWRQGAVARGRYATEGNRIALDFKQLCLPAEGGAAPACDTLGEARSLVQFFADDFRTLKVDGEMVFRKLPPGTSARDYFAVDCGHPPDPLPAQCYASVQRRVRYNLGAIRSTEVAYFAEYNVFVGGQAPTPVADRRGNGRRLPWNLDTRFSKLGFAPEGDVYCSYALEGRDQPTMGEGFTARAECDLDGNGQLSLFSVSNTSNEIVHAGDDW